MGLVFFFQKPEQEEKGSQKNNNSKWLILGMIRKQFFFNFII